MKPLSVLRLHCKGYFPYGAKFVSFNKVLEKNHCRIYQLDSGVPLLSDTAEHASSLVGESG